MTSHLPTGKRRGTVLIIVIVLLLTAIMISGSIVQVLLTDARRLEWNHHAMQAARLAESGLRRGYARLATESEYTSETWSPALPAGEGTVEITVTSHDGATVIQSRATFPADSSRPARATRRLNVSEASSRPEDRLES